MKIRENGQFRSLFLCDKEISFCDILKLYLNSIFNIRLL